MLRLRWGSSCCSGSCVGYSGSGCFCGCRDLFHHHPGFHFFSLFFSWGCIVLCSFAPPGSLPFLAAAFCPALRLVMASLVAIVTFDLALVSALVLTLAIAGVRSQGFILHFGTVIPNLAALRLVDYELLEYFCCEDLASKACACADG